MFEGADFTYFSAPGGRKMWNVGDHRRKFMHVCGDHVERPGTAGMAGDLVF